MLPETVQEVQEAVPEVQEAVPRSLSKTCTFSKISAESAEDQRDEAAPSNRAKGAKVAPQCDDPEERSFVAGRAQMQLVKQDQSAEGKVMLDLL